jgi:haloalkane dehalogenase
VRKPRLQWDYNALVIQKLRTPDERFVNLPDYPFAPRYVEDLPDYAGLRMHYLDEGARDAQTFLCLHGQPTWSYLFRKMIPIFLGSGARVVAPDLFGFGRSDKPTEDATYTYHFHRRSLRQFIERLDLRRITLVCQDWGGLYGLTLVPELSARFERLIVMNTTIPIGRDPGPGFLAWRDYCRSQHDMNIGRLLRRSAPTITENEAAAYDAPFPDATYKAGVRRFPDLVPITPEMDGVAEGRRALEFWSKEWNGKSFMAIGLLDQVIPPSAMEWLHRMIRHCPPPLRLETAGHFVQEQQGEVVAHAALAAFAGAGEGAGR